MPNVQKVPRGHKRQPIPFSAGVIVVEVSFAGDGDGQDGAGLTYPATLWDITREGCCALVQGHLDEQVGHRCQLTMRDAQSPEVVSLEATVQWCDPEMHNAFCGFSFLQQGGLPVDTFLESYLQDSWAD
ncbi:hypothetical protein KBZ20_05530 [Vulcanococcus limneticus Candia 3F8]|uniref:hypothetical protein n=1 Tax=Vulcanococcus limneticus TaxID=2170428 RepID=UPI000B980A9E|nr:hypothetical protein [Vulcanococcus limneticus]MCP9791919.1 hypothetical protein [Vulcanococcus limneticus MW73D5]MCP9893230.1 hypothetical protein [Vulcanococcus limneticus Candia 3F8]MCP9897373.1 hypothetical protein [Vulcanococcus limneticus Candia 3B3]